MKKLAPWSSFQNGDLLCPTYDCEQNKNKLFIMLHWDKRSGACKIYNIKKQKIIIISGRILLIFLEKVKRND
tara:strand:+ start:1367 stop:1582 length:216 start_codon:yes stop_codon:yes gene_type:complete